MKHIEISNAVPQKQNEPTTTTTKRQEVSSITQRQQVATRFGSRCGNTPSKVFSVLRNLDCFQLVNPCTSRSALGSGSSTLGICWLPKALREAHPARLLLINGLVHGLLPNGERNVINPSTFYKQNCCIHNAHVSWRVTSTV